jgi:hypothetical protein
MLARRQAMLHGLWVAALCAAFFLQGLCASRVKSPTNDEPVHIVSGAAYISTGRVVANPQHPPLVKELAGLSLALAGIRLPAAEGRRPGFEWAASIPFLANAGVDRALFRARLPMLLLATLLGPLIYWWGRELAGPRAGLCALFLFAADPTMVAHSYLVTTDVGVTTLSLLFLLALYRYQRQPGTGRLLAAGAALGLALCAKFSAIFLLPLAALLLLARPASPPPSGHGAGVGARMVSALSTLAAMGTAAVFVIMVAYLSPRGPVLYLHGLRRVNADHIPGSLFYLAGQLKTHFASYFAVAWLVKEPAATIALAVGGAVLAARSRTIPRLSKLFLFLPPAVFFVACTVWADDIGIRYLIPALPFAYLAGGIALQALLSGRTLPRVVAAAACAWVALAAAGIYPDHLSYFNEAACLPGHTERIGWDGGSRCGPDWLAESNVDWGQSLPQLKAWLDSNAPGRTVRLDYFGPFPPAAYGILSESATRYLTPLPPRGLYAVSSHNVAMRPVSAGLDWMRDPPVAVVGHAYYIFDIDY